MSNQLGLHFQSGEQWNRTTDIKCPKRFSKPPPSPSGFALHIVEIERLELSKYECKSYSFPFSLYPQITHIDTMSPFIVGGEGFEPPMFTQRDGIYSAAQHHHRCRPPIFFMCAVQDSNLRCGFPPGLKVRSITISANGACFIIFMRLDSGLN